MFKESDSTFLPLSPRIRLTSSRGEALKKTLSLLRRSYILCIKKEEKRAFFTLKLYLGKAYERLELLFTEYCLQFFNFSDDFISSIMSCVKSSSSVISYNGKGSRPFIPTIGIHQGEPLSPNIFIICLEHLSWQIHEPCQSKHWHPFKIRSGSTEISHLFFTDEILLFEEAKHATLASLKSTLNSFFHLSGQKANEEKSMFCFSPNTNLRHYIWVWAGPKYT